MAITIQRPTDRLQPWQSALRRAFRDKGTLTSREMAEIIDCYYGDAPDRALAAGMRIEAVGYAPKRFASGGRPKLYRLRETDGDDYPAGLEPE